MFAIHNCTSGFQYAKEHINTATNYADIYDGAYINDLLVGIVGGKTRSRFCFEICHLYVDARYRQQGIGLALVNNMGSNVIGGHLCANTVSKNNKAIRLFLKAGFDIKCKYMSPYSDNILYYLEKGLWVIEHGND